MRISRMGALWLALGLMAIAGRQAAAQAASVPAPKNWYTITWQIRSLPTINALNFTADQLAQVIPLLKQINKQMEDAGAAPPVDARTATLLAQLREGLLRGNLTQADVDNAKSALEALDAQQQKVFEGLPAVQQLKKLLTDEQKATLEGAVILTTGMSPGLHHRPPIPMPPAMPSGADLGRYRAERVLENVRQMPDNEYQQKRTQWATQLVELSVKRDDPTFATKVTALAALFDGARKLTNDQFQAQRNDLVNQILPYTTSTEGPAAPPPPPPPPNPTAGHPNLQVLTDPRVIDLLELKLTYLQAPAEGG
jgi:hypothetical protein